MRCSARVLSTRQCTKVVMFVPSRVLCWVCVFVKASAGRQRRQRAQCYTIESLSHRNAVVVYGGVEKKKFSKLQWLICVSAAWIGDGG